MKRSYGLLMAILASSTLNLSAYADSIHFSVKIPTIEEEGAYLWGVLQDYQFFIDNKYDIALPTNDSFITWINKAKNNDLMPSEYSTFIQDFSRIYDPDDYASGYDRAIQTIPFLETVLTRCEPFAKEWNYRKFDDNTIVLTLYGSGGSYDPDNGTIIAYVNPAGEFKFNQRPEELFVHEMTHIGIENAIVNRFNLSHWEKERLVDRLVHDCFIDLLPNYRMQDISIANIDTYIDKDKWLDIMQNIQAYKQQ